MNNKTQVFHFDLYGKREDKYNFLTKNSLDTINWNTLEPIGPNFFFVKKNFDESGDYEKGFKMDELFGLNACCIKVTPINFKPDLFLTVFSRSLHASKIDCE